MYYVRCSSLSSPVRHQRNTASRWRRNSFLSCRRGCPLTSILSELVVGIQMLMHNWKMWLIVSCSTETEIPPLKICRGFVLHLPAAQTTAEKVVLRTAWNRTPCWLLRWNDLCFALQLPLSGVNLQELWAQKSRVLEVMQVVQLDGTDVMRYGVMTFTIMIMNPSEYTYVVFWARRILQPDCTELRVGYYVGKFMSISFLEWLRDHVPQEYLKEMSALEIRQLFLFLLDLSAWICNEKADPVFFVFLSFAHILHRLNLFWVPSLLRFTSLSLLQPQGKAS